MKKTISLLLALVMLLSLAACSSEPEKSGEELAFEAANALLESGDYHLIQDGEITEDIG